ncbi:MAG: phytanoyl-CoA dioxygenase family protein [Pseudomonadota bacterium]
MTEAFEAGAFDGGQVRDVYERDGYFVLKNVFSANEIAELRAETAEIAVGRRGDVIGADIVAKGADSPEEATQRVLAIHFPHKASDVMRATLFKPEIVKALNAIIGPDVKCMQSMLFVKNAGKPGQAWHQDEFYIPTRDMSLAGVWIALDDARIDNGGLWMHPGSHKHGVIWPTKPHGDERFDSSAEAYDFPYDREGGVPVHADAGDVVVFHGYVLHRSLNNTRTEGFRRAIVNHVMNARSLLPWSMGLPPQPREDFRDIVMVSGEDPYDWKGREDITAPFLRPEDPAQAAEIFGRLFNREGGGA